MLDISKYPAQWMPLSSINLENRMFQFRSNLVDGALLESFKEKGQEIAIVVWVRATGERVVVYGWKRVTAGQAAGFKEMLVIAIPESEHGYEEMLDLRLDENLLKGNYADNDYIGICAGLAAIGKTVREISKRVGRSIGMVSNYLMISKLPGEIQDGIKSGKISQKNVIKIVGSDGGKSRCSPGEQACDTHGASSQVSVENTCKLVEILKSEGYKEKIAKLLKEMSGDAENASDLPGLLDEMKAIVAKRDDYTDCKDRACPVPTIPSSPVQPECGAGPAGRTVSAGTAKRISGGVEMRIVVNAKKITSADLADKIELSKDNTKYLQNVKRELDRANREGLIVLAAKDTARKSIKKDAAAIQKQEAELTGTIAARGTGGNSKKSEKKEADREEPRAGKGAEQPIPADSSNKMVTPAEQQAAVMAANLEEFKRAAGTKEGRPAVELLAKTYGLNTPEEFIAKLEKELNNFTALFKLDQPLIADQTKPIEQQGNNGKAEQPGK